MVCGQLARSMGSSSEFFRRRSKVHGTGSVDRMGLSPSVRSSKTGHQQQPFSDPAGLAFSEFGLPHSIVMPKAACRRLAVSLRPSGGVAGDLCGPPAVPGHPLQSGQLGLCGRHQGLPSDPQGLQPQGRLTEDGFCQAIKG